MVRLGDVKDYEQHKAKHLYAGQDGTILKRFASDNANLFHISQTNPRRNLQQRYLTEITKLEQVPEKTIVDRIPATQLTFDEAMFLVRLRSILLDDYPMSDVDAAFATISHGVSFHVEKKEKTLQISIARKIPSVAVVLECYSTARDVFEGFMKDFVREHLYPHIRDHVPSSTKQGRDALYKRLKENKELFRLQERDYGAIESLLADYLAGQSRIFRRAAHVGRPHFSSAAGSKQGPSWQRRERTSWNHWRDRPLGAAKRVRAGTTDFAR